MLSYFIYIFDFFFSNSDSYNNVITINTDELCEFMGARNFNRQNH
jgi:hypothetical protein